MPELKAPPEILERVGRIQKVCEAHDVPLASAAVQFPLGHEKVCAIVTGAVSRAEVERNAETMAQAIPPALWDDLKSEGLMRQDAPVPEA